MEADIRIISGQLRYLKGGKRWLIYWRRQNHRLGNNAGCEIVLVLTGYGKESYRKKDDCEVRVNFVADDLKKAVEWILKGERRLDKTHVA